MTRYGYARVSTKDQRLDRQIEALVNAGVAYGHIYKDKVTVPRTATGRSRSACSRRCGRATRWWSNPGSA